MKLNLHILAQDVSDLGVRTQLADHWSTMPIRFATQSDGTGQLKSDRLYVMEARVAPCVLPSASERLNILFTGGEPTSALVEAGAHNIAWTPARTSASGLVERLNNRIATYNDWCEDIASAFAEGKPLRRVAEQSEPLFDNPIWMFDAQLQTVFHVMRQDHYVVPENYQRYAERETWPISGINAINDTFKDARTLREPYLLPPMFGYSSLCYNLFDGDIYLATLCIDSISGKPMSDRERALVKFLGDMMGYDLKHQSHFTKHATFTMNAQIEKLLAGGNIPKSRLAASLGKKHWSIDDTYYCIVLQQRREASYSDAILIPLAEHICDEIPQTIYSLAKGQVVLISNYSLSQTQPDDACRIVTDHIAQADLHLRVGISTPFSDFSMLPYFRDQAAEAIAIGKRADPDAMAFFFHDHMREAIVRRCMRDTVPEALCPPSLSRLIRYDKAHGADLVDTLKAYLENNMSTNKTAQALYLHRNTLLSRLKKIESVGKIDLEDSETRFLLSIAFALMK